MGGSDLSRRDVLRMGGAGLAAAAAGGLAGCNGPGEASFRKWLAEPSEFLPIDHYQFAYDDWSTLRANEESFNESTYDGTVDFRSELVEEEWPELGLGFSDVEATVEIGEETITVLQGSFERETVADRVRNNGFTVDTKDYGGFGLYTDPDRQRALGLSSDAIVVSELVQSERREQTSLVQIPIDAYNDEETRYAEDSEDCKRLLETVPDASYISGETFPPRDETDIRSGEFANAVASGQFYLFDGDTLEANDVWVFEQSGDIEESEFEQYVDTEADNDELYSGFSYAVDGRVVTVTASAKIREL